MKVLLIASDSLYNCEVIVKELSKCKSYVIDLADKESNSLDSDKVVPPASSKACAK